MNPMKPMLQSFCSPFADTDRPTTRKSIPRSGSLATLAVALALVTTGTAQVIYSDDFDDNTNTGWSYLDRSGGTALMTTIGGGPGFPSFVEQNGRLEQISTNYSFPRDLLRNDATIGGLALSGSGVITDDHYAISVEFTSLEPGNNNQDHSLVFAYEDEDNFYFITVLPNNLRLFRVANGESTVLYNGVGDITFSHDPTSLVVEVSTASGAVWASYGGAPKALLATDLTIPNGENGVGSNNDAFAIDNYRIDEVNDTTAPSLVLPTSPADGSTDVSVIGLSLVATFDDGAIALENGGTITIDNLDGGADTVITLPDPQVSVAGADLIITPGSPLAMSTNYAVTISGDAVKDLASPANFFAGIFDTSTWNFQTSAPDTTAPTILTLSPADNGVTSASAALVATFDEKIAAVAPAVLINEDFEAGDGGFTVATSTGTDWSRGTPDSFSPRGTISSGNGAAEGSGTCWGTNLGAYDGGAGDPGSYADPTTTCLRSAPIDLTGFTTAQLTFAQAYDLYDPDDVAVVNIIDDTTDTVIAAAVYTVPNGSGGWIASPVIDLSAGLGQVVRIEWCLTGTGGDTDDYLGWYIDDVNVTASIGGITLKNLTDATATTFAPSGPVVAIAGSTLTITPPTPLVGGAVYAVQIAASALTDLSGNPFAGILNDSTWNFTVLKTLVPAFDSLARSSTAGNLDKTIDTGLAVGPIKTDDFFRSYLTFDLSGESSATGMTTLTFPNFNANEGNTATAPQVLTLFLLAADWDGAAQPGPVGTTLATVNFTPSLGNDTQDLVFSSEALTAAFNNALGGELYLGIKSDVEGADVRAFKWLGSVEDPGFEPQLTYLPAGGSGGDTFATWIDSFFPGETDPAIIGKNEDPDGDGIDNGVENFFGTHPGEFSQGLVAGTADAGAGTFAFSHPQGTLASDLSAAYTWSKDLVSFHPEGPNDGTTVTFETQADTPAGFTTVTATVTGTALQKLFIRVQVTPNP
jgi:hypothetical protein